jgi:hypothetical protein
MPLDVTQIEQLQEAIKDAFTPGELEQLLLFKCSEKELADYRTDNDTYPSAILKVIQAAEREGWTADLLRAIAEERPLREDIQALVAQLLAQVEATADSEEAASRAAPEPSAPAVGAGKFSWLIRALRDPIWQGIAGIIALIALIVAVIGMGVPAAVVARLQATPTSSAALLLTPAFAPTLAPASAVPSATMPTPLPSPAATPTPVPNPTAFPTPTPMCPSIQESCLRLVLATDPNHLTCSTGNPLVIQIDPEDIRNMTDLQGYAADSEGQALTSGAAGCACEWQGKIEATPLAPVSSSHDCGFFIGRADGAPLDDVRSILLRLTLDQQSRDYLITVSTPATR